MDMRRGLYVKSLKGEYKEKTARNNYEKWMGKPEVVKKGLIQEVT